MAVTAVLLRGVVDLPIYPGKGYSATLDILRPEAAPNVSMIDDAMKCAITRLGTQLRVAGTIELNGYNLALDTALARALPDVDAPGGAGDARVCDTREAAEGGNPRYWCGLRPATPTNIPFIGGTGARFVGQRWAWNFGLDAQGGLGPAGAAHQRRAARDCLSIHGAGPSHSALKRRVAGCAGFIPAQTAFGCRPAQARRHCAASPAQCPAARR